MRPALTVARAAGAQRGLRTYAGSRRNGLASGGPECECRQARHRPPVDLRCTSHIPGGRSRRNSVRREQAMAPAQPTLPPGPSRHAREPHPPRGAARIVVAADAVALGVPGRAVELVQRRALSPAGDQAAGLAAELSRMEPRAGPTWRCWGLASGTAMIAAVALTVGLLIWAATGSHPGVGLP